MIKKTHVLTGSHLRLFVACFTKGYATQIWMRARSFRVWSTSPAFTVRLFSSHWSSGVRYKLLFYFHFHLQVQLVWSLYATLSSCHWQDLLQSAFFLWLMMWWLRQEDVIPARHKWVCKEFSVAVFTGPRRSCFIWLSLATRTAAQGTHGRTFPKTLERTLRVSSPKASISYRDSQTARCGVSICGVT